MDENEAVTYRHNSFYNGMPSMSKIHACKIALWSSCQLKVIFGKIFHQLNNQYVVKQQYNPLNALYFYPSQLHFHSCQKLNLVLPWLKSIGASKKCGGVSKLLVLCVLWVYWTNLDSPDHRRSYWLHHQTPALKMPSRGMQLGSRR